MTRFKVGDTVRRINCNNGCAARVGQIATVVHTDNPGFVSVRYDGYTPDLSDSTVESWRSSMVELVGESNMNKPHKHRDIIIAWANGAQIQYKCYLVDPSQSCRLFRWVDINCPFWSEDVEYRIKPSTIKYRNFLWRSATKNPATMCVVEFDDNNRENRATWVGFIRWVGDWQEVEV